MDYQNRALQAFLQELKDHLAKVSTQSDLETIRVTFLGRKGKITSLMAQLKTLSVEEKRIFGPELNKLKEEASAAFESKQQVLETQAKTAQAQQAAHFDVTSYQPGYRKGTLHPYTIATEEVENIFISMGFAIAEGPEVETDYINFEALNIPANHPARDMHDTFWLDVPDLLLRTHTSTVQHRTMKQQTPPIAIAVPGRAYRHEATDASHDFMFLQCEGLVIDKNINMAHLLGTIKQFLQALYKKEKLDIRLRPSYFPFVEPGVEIDMTCPFCTKGCSVCKQSRWIEICGAGMVHPAVLKAGGIDSEKYSGFAFGFGLTRLIMLKYGINDIRLLHNPKIDFLKQF
jgi:phenylalanyl-tRNA synthetase alpha chain